jgi:nicotinamide N-methyltransferase
MPTPEDILSSSLQSLYAYTPVTFSDSIFTHEPSGLTLVSPDTAPSNWGLHASSVWIASIFLANHLDNVDLTSFSPHEIIHVLELGAGSGLPGILFAKRNSGKATVTLSDYPDEGILHALEENLVRNQISPSLARVVGHLWGQSTAVLGTFDVVLAADTLWNSEMHTPFCQTLSRVLRRNTEARIYLVAGLHTGRWTIRRFLEKLEEFGLVADQVKERKVDNTFDYDPNDPICGLPERGWAVEREGEEESERRNWIVWIVVKWAEI